MKRLIIGIDPGTNESACVVLDTVKWEPVIVWYGKNVELVPAVTKQIKKLYGNGEIPLICYERMRKYTPGDREKGVGDSTFFTCKWYGRMVEGFYQFYGSDVEIVSNTSPSVKIALLGVTNIPRAKIHVKRALYEHFEQTGGGATPAVGTKKQPGPLFLMRSGESHNWDALAVAVVTHMWKDNKFVGEFLPETPSIL